MKVAKRNAHIQRSRRSQDISAEQVATYIKLGHRKVAGTAYDPYAKYKNQTQAILRDAMKIATWFNTARRRWDAEHREAVLKSITNIQFGPAHFWKETLRELLSDENFKAAASWAERHKAGHYVDVSLCISARDAIFEVLNNVIRLDHMMEPYRAMLDVLRFTFYGLADDSKDNSLAL